MNTLKDSRFWDRHAAKYAQDAIADQAGYERSLERTHSLLKPTDHMLEIGCGTGSTALHHAPQVMELLGTDISPKMVAIANDKLAATPHTHVDFIVATAHEQVVPTNSQNVVMAHNILHLVRDLPTTLETLHLSLKPGGLLIAKTPCLGHMNPLLTYIAIPLMGLIGKAPFVGIFKADTLKSALESAGFAIEAEEYHGSRNKGRDVRPYIVARKAR
ncbi:MAG: class I SAM-dependent methyltransferase [Pseudomonadota bacterium]